MRTFNSKKRYSKISFEKRLKLIEFVEEEGMNIAKAAKKLRIKIPTAKVILTNYRKKGHIFKKKSGSSESARPNESKTPAIKEEVVEERQVQEQIKVQPLTPINYYPFYMWNMMNPIPSFLMF